MRDRLYQRSAALMCVGVLSVHGVGCERVTSQEPAPLRVAAASDLARAMVELGQRFEAQTGQRVEVVLGSTGLMARQIEQGAPFDVFASASPMYVSQVASAGRCDASTRARYARGRLALVTRQGLAPVKALSQLSQAPIRRVALANPEHAPYGVAAKQVLQRAGLEQALSGRVVYGQHVSQTLQLVRSGSVDAAFVARALVEQPDQALMLDQALHEPIEQELIVCSSAPGLASVRPQARALAAFILGPAGQAILARHGFEPPAGVASAQEAR